MSELTTYIPMDRRQALARHEPLPDRAIGTALFVDISGFTPLTAVLAEELGPQRGAEAITHHLNKIYGRLISVVHQYHGSVIGFSGDGITCWFDGDNGLGGANAAYAMQQLVADMDVISTPSGQQLILSIKTAVANGAVRRFLVGNAHINTIDILAGTLLDTIATIEQSLSPGEIGIDSTIAAIIGKNDDTVHHQTTKQGDSFYLLNGPPPEINVSNWPDHAIISREIAGQWLLPLVLNQLERGQSDFLAELRPVVACFLNFTGIDYDNDLDAAKKLNAFIQNVQMVLTRYGGHLLEVTIGDKGSYLYAAFGAPQANEDDADRAIYAALDLIKSKKEFEYIQDLKIGISRGRMRTGAYGSESRRIYGVHGIDVNLAARLMAQAEPGQILVSKNLIEVSRSDKYYFQELGDVQLKGFSKPIATYVVLKHKDKLATPPSVSGDIVGRDSERFLFSQYLFALRNGESNLVLVEGEAGIGKSFLVHDLLKLAKSRNFIYLLGAGDAIGQSTPYHAWREIVQQLLGVPLNTVSLDEDSKRVLRQKVLARLNYLDPDLVPFAPLLNIFLPLDFPEDALTAQMSEVARADNIHDLVIRLVQETAVSAPVLLVFEDAHWMDSSSSTLLRLIQRTVSPLLIVVVTRPQTAPFPVTYTQLRDHPNTHHMVLSTLSKEAIDTLVCKRLGVTQLPPPIAQLIHEKAEGHPFFSEELAYSLRDSQIIQIDDGVCYLSTEVEALTALTFPDTIQGVIISRLDQLAPQHQIALKVASVIGRLFVFKILHDIYPDHADKQYLKENILELEQLAITLQETPEPNLAYIFKHMITQEVTYNLMTFEQRQQLHRRTAEVYELFYSADLSNAFELLAHHWSKAEDNTKAIHYLERAGEQAFKNAANAEVIYFFTQALALDKAAGFISDKNRRARWELMSGIANVNWSRYQRGLQHLDAGLTLLGKPRPTGAILRKVGRTIQQILRQDLFKIHAPQYEKKSVEEQETLLAASRAYARLVEVDYHLGDLVGSIFDSFYALNLAEEAGPSPEYAEAAAPVGIFWGLLPWRNRAESYLDRALKTAEKAKNNEVLSYTLMVKGTYEAGIGQWADAQMLYERIITLNKQFASRRLNDGYHHLARTYYLQGRYEESWETAVSLINSAKKLNDQRFEAYGIQCQAYVLLYQGRLHEALCNLDILYELFSAENKIDDEQMELDTYGLLALVHLRLGNLEKAFQFARLADGLASPFPSGYYNLPGYANSAEVYLSLWEQNYHETSLPKLTQQACNALDKYARIFTIGKPRSYLLQGRFAWQKGKKRKAYKGWQKGLVAAETLKMPYDQGCLHFEMGRRSEELLNRKDHLQKAQIIFGKLGAAYDFKQVEKWL